MSRPGHLKYHRRRRGRRLRRGLLILLGALFLTALLSWALRLFDGPNSVLPPAPAVPDDATVQFK